jgi:hypothetical protein
MWLLLINGSMTDERDPSNFIKFPAILPINYSKFKPKSGIKKHKISAPG